MVDPVKISLPAAPAIDPLPDLAIAPRRSYLLSRWVFFRLLGIVYLVAFWSLGVQITGLVGQHGILPVRGYLVRLHEVYGSGAWRVAPTLCWYSASDGMLQGLCWGGSVLAVLLILDVAPAAVLALLWVGYLSLAVAGQAFLNFQWDALLLETGLLAFFYAPWSLWPRCRTSREPGPRPRWLLWLLLVKLMILSGVTKLASGDATWWNLTALTYHFQTQPLPTWAGWFAQQLPAWWQKFSVLIMYGIEIVAALGVFAPPRLRPVRLTACGLLVFLQLLIALTGNYGFFNILSIVLCLTLIDDGAWLRIWPRRFAPSFPTRREPAAWRWTGTAAACVIVPLSLLVAVQEIVFTLPRQPPRWAAPLQTLTSSFAPLRSINGYGLFRQMTTKRPEIVIEASQDGVQWTEYAFRYKPGDVARRPPFCVPYMPRLDWQMWFAALNPRGNEYWLGRLLEHLLSGTPEVQALLSAPPLPGQPPAGPPPRYVRMVLYEYRFAPLGAKDRAWWTRERIGELTGPLSLPANRQPP